MRQLWRIKAFVFILLFGGMGHFGLAQDSDLKDDIEGIKRDLLTIRKDLADIKSILKTTARSQGALPTPTQVNVKGVEFDFGDNPIKGNIEAKLVLVEFTDYQCPFCGRFVRETFPQISEQYIDKGIIRFAVIDKPLPMHIMAAKAAEASHCAIDQGKFWEMHNLMMSKQEALENLSSYATSLKLDVAKFEDCLKTNKYKEQIDKEAALALKLGIQGVPGFIIASVDPANPTKAKGISLIRGAVPFAEFQKEISQAQAGLSLQKAAQ